jgi:hypothetical protein
VTITDDGVAVRDENLPGAAVGSGAPGGARGVRLDAIYTGVFAVLGWAIGIARLSDNSFFLHLRTGRLILERGVPHSDPYSFTAHGVRWVAQSWLAELLYGVLDRAFGAASIRILGAVVAAAIAALTLRLALRLVRDRTRAVGLTVAVFGCMFALWSERQLVLGALAFLALVWVVEVPESWAGRRAVFLIPPLLWVWANVHGSFMFGFAFLGLHLAGRWLEGERPWTGRQRGLLVGAVAGAAVCLLNPYGPALLTFPFELLGRGDVLAKVVEWKSPDFRTFQGQVFAVWLVVLVVALARGRSRVSRRDLVVAVPFLLLAFWAQRNIAMAAFATLPVVARAVALPDCDETRERRADRLATGRVLVALLALMLVYSSVDAITGPAFDFHGNPVAAMHAVEHDGLLGRRVAEWNGWGGYVALRYWPRQPVFMDDRFDMYPVPFIRETFELQDVTPQWQDVLRRTRVEVVVWRTDDALSQVLAESPDWVRVHRDLTAVVFVRRDVAAAARLVAR